jgi:tetratricopeptide (TPR) repeat protein
MEPQMDPKKRSAEIWAALLAFVAKVRNSNERLINRLMGRAKDHLGTMRRRRKPPTLEDAIRLAGASGMPEWMVFGQLFPRPLGPAEVLRQLRQCRQPGEAPAEPPPLLARLEQAWAPIARKGTIEGKRQLSARRRLSWIDEARHEDEAEGSRLLENEIVTQLCLLDCAKAPPATVLADLAVAVAMWADQLRLGGQADAALVAFPLALELAERSEEGWASAHCHFLAALLVHDLGLGEQGVEWLGRAGCLFAAEGEAAYLQRVLAAQGCLLVSLWRYRSALPLLRGALEKLPAGDRRFRPAALLALAEVEQALGRLPAARACLEPLAQDQLAPESFQTQVKWRQAAIDLAAGDAARTTETFSQAVASATRLGRPLEVLFALCEFAEQMLHGGRSGQVCGLAEEVLCRWGKRSENRKLAEAMEDFYALARLRPLVRGDIEGIRKKLKKLGPAPRKIFPGTVAG